MSYKIQILDTAKKDVKKLIKKYPKIKDDLLDLTNKLEENPFVGIHIGKNFYKIRMKNSSINKGKSGGFRVIYFVVIDEKILILKIYSKNEIENLSDEYIFSLLKA
jgi:mRNA-degrading endonuclease RelE of RelBE toxin-antitoxin system